MQPTGFKHSELEESKDIWNEENEIKMSKDIDIEENDSDFKKAWSDDSKTLQEYVFSAREYKKRSIWDLLKENLVGAVKKSIPKMETPGTRISLQIYWLFLVLRK
eukprot:TRINITY_DN1484_c0_g1_i3.p1 TRINITY_DN1484_c0_g1~~TRINITY_DN1484_c0_g1_i3.p1  ORF type:complete len:105 (+),score=14.24 TRINITY_DN1484_c0_g1_i3:113-427(+)